MSDAEQSHYEKYKDSIKNYQNTLWRPSIAIKSHFKEPFTKLVEASGAESMAELICALAANGDALAPQLAPLVIQFRQQREIERAAGKRSASKVVSSALAQGLTEQEIEAALRAAAAAKSAGARE